MITFQKVHVTNVESIKNMILLTIFVVRSTGIEVPAFLFVRDP